jgi:hypothetical protein
LSNQSSSALRCFIFVCIGCFDHSINQRILFFFEVEFFRFIFLLSIPRGEDRGSRPDRNILCEEEEEEDGNNGVNALDAFVLFYQQKEEKQNLIRQK